MCPYTRVFSVINTLDWDELFAVVESERLGQYKVTTAVWACIASLDLDTSTAVDFLRIPGIGLKTARFLAGYLNDEEGAVLDTHVLAWGREQGFRWPKRITSPTQYLEIEKEYLAIARLMGLHPLDLDTSIWTERNKNHGKQTAG